MPTIATYAKMAQAIYCDDPAIDGWSRVFQPSGSGLTDAFQGVAFKKGGDIVFAFKGTSQKRDVVADLKLFVGMNTYLYGSAVDFVKKTQIPANTRVSLCGHSLGGAIAQVVGNRQRLPFVTFNAPGVALVSRNLDQVAATVRTGSAYLRLAGAVASTLWHPIQAARDGAALLYWVRGVNFRLGKDIVGRIGVHYGKVIEIPYAGGALDVHGIESVITAIKSSPYVERQLHSLIGG